MRSETKVAIVTGARRGIGLGIAKALAGAGYFIIASGVSPEAEEALAAIRAVGPGADYIRCDIGNSEDRLRLFTQVDEQYGRLDLLVNNAGVAPRERLDILETTEQNFGEVIDTNLKGTFFMCQLGAKLMLHSQKAGIADYAPRIINLSSISAYTASVNRGEYCISKAGISMTTQLFAARLAPLGIAVFEVRPGIIQTDMTAGVQDKYQSMIDDGLTPVPRMGTPEDVAACVLALASGQMDFAAGQVINADGGFHIRRL